MNCTNCHQNKAEHSAVIKGVYYEGLCDGCFKLLNRGQVVSSGHARWARSIDTEDHEADIQQPYGKDGKPNAKFIKLYPRQASYVFDEKQMRDASR